MEIIRTEDVIDRSICEEYRESSKWGEEEMETYK